MKIVAIIPNLLSGGAQRVILNLANEWVRLGHSVKVLSGETDESISALFDPRVELVFYRVTRLREWFWILFRFFNRENFDVAFLNMWPLTTIGTLAWTFNRRRNKVFLVEHTTLSRHIQCDMPTPMWMARLLIFISHRIASGVVAVSNGVKLDLIKLGALESRVRVIYNPVIPSPLVIDERECANQNPLNWKRETGIKLLAVGALVPSKCFDLLIAAVCTLNRDTAVSLTILGDGPLKGFLQMLVDQLGLSDVVFLAGNVEDPIPWYRAADMTVVSSNLEGFGNVIVESLSVGTPVVSTNCQSGPSEILADGRYGILVDVNSSVALERGIRKALIHRWEEDLLIKRSEDFSARERALDYLNYFQDK